MPLRLWPGVLVVVLQWVAWFVVPIFVPEAGPFGVVGALLGGLAIVVWLTFYSRAPRSERWGAVVLMVASSRWSRAERGRSSGAMASPATAPATARHISSRSTESRRSC